VPDSIPNEEAAVLELLTTPSAPFRTNEVKLGSFIVVLGPGPSRPVYLAGCPGCRASSQRSDPYLVQHYVWLGPAARQPADKQAERSGPRTTMKLPSFTSLVRKARTVGG